MHQDNSYFRHSDQAAGVVTPQHYPVSVAQVFQSLRNYLGDPIIIQDDRKRAARIGKESGWSPATIGAMLAGQRDNWSCVRELALLRVELIEKYHFGIVQALSCTPSISAEDGSEQPKIIYDCGDPWEILRSLIGMNGTQHEPAH